MFSKISLFRSVLFLLAFLLLAGADSLNPQTNKKLYYAKNVGLIMYEDFDDNIWELVEYDVFQ